ncbi:Bug family tripartite tricarboxylate transporter substrate binding protein [Bordetella genomosp. 10]|nr:tripartite tricarboxylate transporter substrate binding protein [Bordetella genomosp. 10]
MAIKTAPGHALTIAAAMAAATLIPAASLAQSKPWPDHAVRIIVPFVAAGPTDAQARWVAQQLSAATGQSFIVENRGAAGGTPGTQYVAKSPPDGYTLLVANPGPLTVGPQLRDTGYTLKDLAPITLLSKSPSCVVVKPAIPAKTFKEFVALAKSKPGQINYGSAGLGTVGQLTTELIAQQAGIKLNHIPYRGAAQVTTDLLGGAIDMNVMQIGTCVPLAKQGKLRALAVTSLTRYPQLPDVPTLSESGLPGFEFNNWNGVLAPAGTSPEILKKISDVLGKALATHEARSWLASQGYTAGHESLASFGTLLAAESARWGKLIQVANIKPE